MKAIAHIVGQGDVEVEVSGLVGEQAAEMVFAVLNHGSGVEMAGYKGRSFSVGDSVTVPSSSGATRLQCAPIGWTNIDVAKEDEEERKRLDAMDTAMRVDATFENRLRDAVTQMATGGVPRERALSFPTSCFTFVKKECCFVAELSELEHTIGPTFIGYVKLYGLKLVSDRTGREVHFKFKKEERDREGELLSIDLEPSEPAEQGLATVRLLND